MTIVNVHEAKTHLSRLLERVEQGEEVVIARNNRPVARLVAHMAPERRPGSLRGRMRIADDFDDPLPDELADAFGG
jgi:prevent-host-death family protein